MEAKLILIQPMMVATFGQAFVFSNSIAKALQHFDAEFSGKASAMFSSLQIILTGIFSAVVAIS